MTRASFFITNSMYSDGYPDRDLQDERGVNCCLYRSVVPRSCRTYENVKRHGRISSLLILP